MTNSANFLTLRDAYRVMRRQWLAEASDEEIEVLVGDLERVHPRDMAGVVPETILHYSDKEAVSGA